jgi:UDP-GlcNAc:undecaprenyl-phosphate GlcNAc-1-phosphate transferase
MSMPLFLALLGATALAFSAALTLAMRSLAPRLGLTDRPDARKDHATPTPLGGGVAMYVAFWGVVWAGVAVAAVVASQGVPDWIPLRLRDLAAGVPKVWLRLLVIFAASSVIAFMGLADDRWRLPAAPRLAVQVAAALGMFLGGVRITIFQQSALASGFITLLWIVTLTNSFNWLDNMDGLAGGVALIISAILAVVAFQTNQLFLASGLAVLIGAIGGFLAFNWPPASIFMGDCGAMHLGVLLAALSAEFTYYRGPSQEPLFPVVAPLLIFAVPLFDTVSVMVIRWREGRPIHKADHSHFSHRLVALGMTRSQAVLTVHLVTLALGLGATGLYHATAGGVMVTLVQSLAIIAIIVVLERAPKKKT